MPNNQTKRGYPLPHPENIAVQDVVRIRTTIKKIDEDIAKRENEHNQLKKAFDKLSFENFLNFWSNNR
ncbi:hypothetical protein [Wolbachia endosymbiont (group B) of Erynnis tages]|uniref:hypothetical protein n=1 Tax=Wolbachia endosymbiont (group B) of Erynnis tages TaxID=2954011 RepID=UPI002227F5E6|nr:hypothetical protein [Wolbachia endosymbiont (group B) of Erynnis tages]